MLTFLKGLVVVALMSGTMVAIAASFGSEPAPAQVASLSISTTNLIAGPALALKADGKPIEVAAQQ